jgi:hypothetical protein
MLDVVLPCGEVQEQPRPSKELAEPSVPPLPCRSRRAPCCHATDLLSVSQPASAIPSSLVVHCTLIIFSSSCRNHPGTLPTTALPPLVGAPLHADDNHPFRRLAVLLDPQGERTCPACVPCGNGDCQVNLVVVKVPLRHHWPCQVARRVRSAAAISAQPCSVRVVPAAVMGRPSGWWAAPALGRVPVGQDQSRPTSVKRAGRFSDSAQAPDLNFQFFSIYRNNLNPVQSSKIHSKFISCPKIMKSVLLFI